MLRSNYWPCGFLHHNPLWSCFLAEHRVVMWHGENSDFNTCRFDFREFNNKILWMLKMNWIKANIIELHSGHSNGQCLPGMHELPARRCVSSLAGADFGRSVNAVARLRAALLPLRSKAALGRPYLGDHFYYLGRRSPGLDDSPIS